MVVRHMLITAVVLGIFAVVGTGLVALTFNKTEDRITVNAREALAHRLNAMVPPSTHDNDMATDIITVTSKELLGSTKPVKVYRARQDGNPVAVIFSPVAPDGYNGNITLLVAIGYTGNILGTRVVSHRETPGLGDPIEIERSNWIEGFTGRSLANPGDLGWHVKRDGGEFDQFTGATITPRAVVKAVYNSLQYFEAHKDELFASSAGTPGEHHDSN